MRLKLAALTLPATAHAETLAGPWRVAGSVIGHAFVLDCRFEANGGACVETGKGEGHAGKVHPLTQANLAGNRATWSYPVTHFFMKFDMTFAGTLTGDRITGTASAAGRQGPFTATRVPR